LFKGNQTENINDMVAKGRQGRFAEHGRNRMYHYYKCRCDICIQFRKKQIEKQRIYARKKYLADIL
jgi:hypothetical protein